LPGVSFVIGGVVAAARFLPVAWRASWAALALAGVAVALALAGGGGGWWLAAAPLALITRGGLWRLALGEGRAGPGGLQWGRIETRLAAAWALTALFFAILGMLLLVVLLCCAYAAASAGRGFDPAQVATWTPAIDGRGRVLLGAVAAAGGGAMVWAALRTSLAEAASVARGKVQVLAAWPLTRGRTLGLLAAHLAIAAPAILAALPRPAGPPSWPWAIFEAAAIAGLWLPMNVGLMAYGLEASNQQ
jgi:hypothetical protein